MSSENKLNSHWKSLPPTDPLCQRAAWHDRCGAYNNTAAGYLGKKRPTMLNNPLLARNKDCGRQNKTFFAPDIGENFAHGDDYRDIFNVGHAISGWTGIVSENKRRESKPDGPRPRDYMSMNRAATAHGVSNARELRDFKDTHEVFRPGATAGSQKKPVECRPAARIVDKEAVYGDPTVPDKTSMKHLLSTKYGDDWLKCQPKRLPNQKADKPVRDDKGKQQTQFKTKGTNSNNRKSVLDRTTGADLAKGKQQIILKTKGTNSYNRKSVLDRTTGADLAKGKQHSHFKTKGTNSNNCKRVLDRKAGADLASKKVVLDSTKGSTLATDKVKGLVDDIKGCESARDKSKLGTSKDENCDITDAGKTANKRKEILSTHDQKGRSNMACVVDQNEQLSFKKQKEIELANRFSYTSLNKDKWLKAKNQTTKSKDVQTVKTKNKTTQSQVIDDTNFLNKRVVENSNTEKTARAENKTAVNKTAKSSKINNYQLSARANPSTQAHTGVDIPTLQFKAIEPREDSTRVNNLKSTKSANIRKCFEEVQSGKRENILAWPMVADSLPSHIQDHNKLTTPSKPADEWSCRKENILAWPIHSIGDISNIDTQLKPSESKRNSSQGHSIIISKNYLANVNNRSTILESKPEVDKDRRFSNVKDVESDRCNSSLF